MLALIDCFLDIRNTACGKYEVILASSTKTELVVNREMRASTLLSSLPASNITGHSVLLSKRVAQIGSLLRQACLICCA